MKRAMAILLRAALGISGVVALAGVPAAAQQFSADFVNTGAANAQGPRKIYVANGKVRMESAGDRAMPGFVISDANAKTAYMVIPQQKAYMEVTRMAMMTQAFMPVDPNDPCPQWKKIGDAARNGGPDQSAGWTCKRVGSEAVGGRATIKYEVASPKGERMYSWVDPKLRFTVKANDASGHGIELRNIVEGPQPAGLFVIPADYQKMDMGEMMKRMMQRGAQPPGG
jgi:hypothetical protein